MDNYIEPLQHIILTPIIKSTSPTAMPPIRINVLFAIAMSDQKWLRHEFSSMLPTLSNEG